MRKYKRNIRTVSTLAALISPTRQAILTATFLRPEMSWYLSELATQIETRPSSLQRDVDSLVRVVSLRSVSMAGEATSRRTRSRLFLGNPRHN